MTKSYRVRTLLLLLLCLLGGLTYIYWSKTVSQPQLIFYHDVFCLTLERTDSEDKQQLMQLMETRVRDNSNSYALKKQRFSHKAAARVIEQWQALPSKQQQEARTSREVCRQLLAKS